MYVDIYNFVIGYFLHYDYLNIVGYYEFNEKNYKYMSNNIVAYNIPYKRRDMQQYKSMQILPSNKNVLRKHE